MKAAHDDAPDAAARATPFTVSLFGRSQVGKERAQDEDAFLVSDLTGAPPLHQMTSSLSLKVQERGILVAVSDGMGGAQAGEVASSLALASLWRGMRAAQAATASVALRAAVEGANLDVFDNASATGREGMGATLTAVLFFGTNAYIAEIGDSRAYLVRGRTIAQITHDQTVVQRLVDAGTLTREDAETSAMKNLLVQAMGIGATIDVALTGVSLRRHDRFLICSDGLSGSLTDQEMLALLLTDATLEVLCTNLIQAAVDSGGTDDITVVLADVAGEADAGAAVADGSGFDVTLPMIR